MLCRKSILFLLIISSHLFADVRVDGYYRKNGTYVQPHYRSNPDGKFYNNWSTDGNINPYTGEYGTKKINPNQGKVYKTSTKKDLYLPYTRISNLNNNTQVYNLQSSATKSVPISPLDSDPKNIVRQRLKSLNYKGDTSSLSLLEMLELETRIYTAQSLRKLGYLGDTANLSHMEMLEIESKINACQRLKNLGYTNDTSNLTLIEMLDIESKINASQRLKNLGYANDTSNLSLIDMLDLESRVHSIQRLRNLGFKGDISQLSLNEVLDLESKIRSSYGLKKLWLLK